jgi:predicted nucleic acid-binding protein
VNALNTNIWIYLHDTRDEAKHQQAQKILGKVSPLALPWQVGCEFVAACRKLQPYSFTEEMGRQALSDMQAAADLVLLPEPSDWQIARQLRKQHSL